MPRTVNFIWICGLAVAGLHASEHRGVVKSNGLPVPGVTITATKGDKKAVTTTDENGNYAFANLEDGIWNFQLSMIGFAKSAKEIGVTPGGLPAPWELKMMTLAEMKASIAPPTAATPKPAPATASAAAPASAAAAPAPAQERRQRPSIAAAPQAARRGGRGGTRPGTGFQRTEVNPSEEAPSIAESNISNEMVSELNQSANDSFLVNGSVSRGLGMPEQADWGFPGGRGGFDGMGFGPGMGPGTGMGDGMGGGQNMG